MGSSEPGSVSVGDWLAPHLAGNPAVVDAALPEASAVAWDISNHLVLIGEVHLPDEGPVTKNPHPSLALPPWWRRRLSPRRGLWTAGRDYSFPDARNRLRRRKVCTPCLGTQSTLGLAVRRMFSYSSSVIIIIFLLA